MTEFNPEKYGFKKTTFEDSGVTELQYETNEFVLTMLVDGDFLTVLDTDEAIISQGKIPANNQSLALMLKAFAIQRPKT